VSPGRPDADGIYELVDVVQLLAVELFEPESGGRRMGKAVKVPSLGLDDVEAPLDLGDAGIDSRHGGLRLSDSFVGSLCPPTGSVDVSKAGVHDVIVGIPHGRPQHTAEIILDHGDGVRMGLPGRSCGGERRLEVGEFVGGLGPPGRAPPGP
jgi:hypothetical protein